MTMLQSVLIGLIIIIGSSMDQVVGFAMGGCPLSWDGRSTVTSSSALPMGIFDDLQLIFSDEGKKKRAAYDAKIREEQEEAQREILERRRNPQKMEQYEVQYKLKREKLMQEKAVWDFQNKVGGPEEGGGNYDPLTEWQRLREEGKITVGSDLPRDPTTSRLGSEGLVDVRTDERLPYIDQGYVDTSSDGPDLVGGMKKLFGGGTTAADDTK
jgi:hypothetical protein